MKMRQTDHLAPKGGTREIPRAPRQVGAIAAVSLCGAVAGASLTEAAATIFTHPAHAMALQPSAQPVALVGAVIGLLAGILWRGRLSGLVADRAAPSIEDDDLDDFAAVLPVHPQSWIPVPSTSHVAIRPIVEEDAQAMGSMDEIPLELHPIAMHLEARRPRAVRRGFTTHPLDLRRATRPPASASRSAAAR